jgi:LPS export ABC transporter protein LptC
MKQKTQKLCITPLLCLAVFVFGRCTFDYGDAASQKDDQADIVMENVEYVRMRDGDPVVRFRAQQAERYETRQAMELQNFSFEQFYDHGSGINATGAAGSGLVELDSGNIQLEQGIIIAVEDEDITIVTETLSWEDEKRILAGSDEHRVNIQRSDGTVFSGTGFSADSRRKTWSFTGGVEGSYVDKDLEDDSDAEPEAPAEGDEAPVEGGAPVEGDVEVSVEEAPAAPLEGEFETPAEEERFEELKDGLLAPGIAASVGADGQEAP